MSLQALADAVGTTRQQLSRLENGHRKLSKEWAERLAPPLGVRAQDLMFELDERSTVEPGPEIDLSPQPVIGEVAAGLWLETEAEIDEPLDWLPFNPAPHLPKGASFILRVRGNSVDKIAPDGAFIVCLSLAQTGIAIKGGDLVVVERRRMQEGLREVTVKRVHEIPGGFELVPESTDPRWKPTRFEWGKEHELEGIEIHLLARVELVVMKP
ncbi:SOS-response transcriptional repressor LexA (RecA-mediated autopeptidase) [Faunimonas pinastri]|uniref:SOS-response transcriptional repressor LexA (RecA-mediated autopeptidase) n=2 Tax=Faunimonas pinastri TaxID=1855383 RepID=A0A1H9I9M9_9HYPH|nr:SOS-response transcriptional repressor LexA (RecA-mediated autopeptidase) [Faunimonas pinastri]